MSKKTSTSEAPVPGASASGASTSTNPTLSTTAEQDVRDILVQLSKLADEHENPTVLARLQGVEKDIAAIKRALFDQEGETTLSIVREIRTSVGKDLGVSVSSVKASAGNIESSVGAGLGASVNTVKESVGPDLKTSVGNIETSVGAGLGASVNTIKESVGPDLKTSVGNVEASVGADLEDLVGKSKTAVLDAASGIRSLTGEIKDSISTGDASVLSMIGKVKTAVDAGDQSILAKVTAIGDFLLGHDHGLVVLLERIAAAVGGQPGITTVWQLVVEMRQFFKIGVRTPHPPKMPY